MEALNSEEKYAVMSSWFLGPKAENRKILDDTFKAVIDEVERGRKKYFKNDPVRLLPSLPLFRDWINFDGNSSRSPLRVK